jgi:mRNA-degrading endonuclease YafQ of YafQ-DinJ toxin-antitoxin module
MLTPSYAKQFGKDLKRMLKGGRSEEKIREVLKRLVNEVNGGQIFILESAD